MSRFPRALPLRRRRPLLLTLAASLLAGLVHAAATASAPPTITFFVASDSHFGARNMSALNREVVAQMNALPGTPYPPAMGGVVEAPRGVLFTGDTTDNGRLEEFAEFEAVYGKDGTNGLLKFPVYVAIGNHDVSVESPVKDRVARLYGGVQYAWDWDDLRLVCLDMYPDAVTREWLAGELRRTGTRRPLILFFHYSLLGPYSDFWEDEDKDAFARQIAGHNVLALFHGHEHHVGHYLWRRHPVFRPGAPRHSSHFFLVVRVSARKMEVAAWNFDDRRFAESWSVPVRRGG